MRIGARRHRKEGISLPWEERGAWVRELLVARRWKAVFLLLAAVGALLLVYRSAQYRERLRDTRIAIAEVKRAIAGFRAEVGRCPRSPSELVHPPSPATHYLHDMPADGWGRDLWVRCPGHFDSEEADVVSVGPSGSFFDDDNVQ